MEWAGEQTTNRARTRAKPVTTFFAAIVKMELSGNNILFYPVAILAEGACSGMYLPKRTLVLKTQYCPALYLI